MTIQNNDVYVGETFDEYLEHHGIKGMHWGIRRTPEQLGHKVSKARERFLKYSEKAQAAGEAGDTKTFNKYSKKAEKTYKSEVKLNKQLEKAIAKQVEADEKVINKGNVDDVLAISYRLSDQQIERAVKRISNQQKIEGLKQQDAAKLDRLVEGSKKIANVAGNVATVVSSIRTFKQAADGIKLDAVKAEREELEYEEKEKAKKRAKELDKIVKNAKMSDITKHQHELSVEQIEEAYKRIYLNPVTKYNVDKAHITNDEELLRQYAHLYGYSNAKKSKSK